MKGPKGTLQHNVAAPIDVSQSDGVLTVTRPNDEGKSAPCTACPAR